MNWTHFSHLRFRASRTAPRFRCSVTSANQARNRYIALVVSLTLTLTTVGCFESKVITSKVNPVSPGGKSGDMHGVFYALPRTVVKADVPVVRTNLTPAALALYTPCFLPNTDFVIRKKSLFAVDSAKVRFDTMFIPDTDEIYLIKTKGGMFETRNLEMSLTESGVLIKASADVTNDTIDIVTGTVKTGASLLAKALPVIALAAPVALDEEQTACRKLIIGAWEEELELPTNTLFNADGSVNEGALAAVPEIPARLKNVQEFQSGYLKAQEIADLVEAFETRRTEIIGRSESTEPSVRADTLKLVLDEIDKTITDLKNTYFLGSEAKIIWNASFRLNPSPAKLSIDLFTLSKEHGVCSIQVNQGVQLDPRFRIGKQCPGGVASCKPAQMVPVVCTGEVVKLEMALGEDGEGGPGGAMFADKVRTAELREGGDRGFYYRIPARAIAFLKQGAAELGRAPLSIAQFGQVVSLPASTGGRKTKYTMELYESSGGLKNFSMGSSALIQQKNIDELAGAASTLIEAKGERQKAKAPADELQQLERQRKILEEKKKIRDLEKELDEDGNLVEGASP